MSKKEGETLKNFVKSKGVAIGKFATDMGYADRQGLNYQFNKDVLDYEVKEKAAEVLGVNIEDIFGQIAKSSKSVDPEKEMMQKLIKTQEDLIRYQTEFIMAQEIREEAFLSVILNRMVERDYPAHKKDRPADLSAALKQAEEDVKEKIEELKVQLRLPS